MVPNDTYLTPAIRGFRQSVITVAVAMLSAAAAHGGRNVEYCRGILDTSRAQVLNHGIPWPAVAEEIRVTIEDQRVMNLLEGRLVEG